MLPDMTGLVGQSGQTSVAQSGVFVGHPVGPMGSEALSPPLGFSSPSGSTLAEASPHTVIATWI